VGKQVVLRELARIWMVLGAPSRAAQCLRDAAAWYLEWGHEDHAVGVLEEALEVCPVDLNAAEEAVRLLQADRRYRDAEKVVQTVTARLEKLKHYREIALLYRMLRQTPESVELRKLGGESLFRQGETAAGIRELLGAARALEVGKDTEEASRIYERVLEMDSSSQEAMDCLQTLQSRVCWRRRRLQWGSVLAAACLVAGWVCWDLSAASAFMQKKEEWQQLDPQESLLEVREEAGSFPLSRYASRLADFEVELSKDAFDADRTLLLQALEAQESGELDDALRFFQRVCRETPFPPLATRAESGLDEVQALLSSTKTTLDQAAMLWKDGKREEAFAAYRQILVADRHEEGVQFVPVWVETVPPGAAVEVDRYPVGEAPRWVRIAPDPSTRIRCSLAGFRATVVEDPVGRLLDGDSPRLRIVLEVENLWGRPDGGGLIAECVDPGSEVLPVLGADGVLRSWDIYAGEPASRLRWAQPVATDALTVRPPREAGPAVIVQGQRGMLFGYSLAGGRLAWSSHPGRGKSGGGPTVLGPEYAGQVVAVVGDTALLVNPLTGLAVRRFELGGEKPSGPVARAGELGVFALEGGGLGCVSLRSGRLESIRDRELRGISGLAESGGTVVVLHGEGTVTGISPREPGRIWQEGFGRDGAEVWAAEGGLLCLGSRSGQVSFRDLRRGTEAGSPVSLPGTLEKLSLPEDTVDRVVAHVTREGRRVLVALSIPTGRVLWELETGPAELSTVHARGSRVVVSTPSLGVVAIRPPGDSGR
jgi:tetratricopeptide (TPR) repeat protein